LFVLSDNNFLERNTCNYIDEFENTVFIKRTEKGFVAKLRFATDGIKAEPLNVELWGVEKKDGDILKLHFTNRELLGKKSVIGGQYNFSVLINYWIRMLNDIKLLDFNESILLNANPKMTREDIAKAKYDLISQYKELGPLMRLVGLQIL